MIREPDPAGEDEPDESGEPVERGDVITEKNTRVWPARFGRAAERLERELLGPVGQFSERARTRAK